MNYLRITSLFVLFMCSLAKSKHEDCEKPPEVEHASIVVSYDENEEFVTATYRCHDGYKLQGKAEITCDLDTDEWEEAPPQCEEGAGEDSESKSTADNKKRRKNKVHEIKEESQITNNFAQQLDLSCMSKGLVKAPSINNGYIAKYNRRRKGEKLFLVAFYECDEDFELENLEQDRLYCSSEKWVGSTPRCVATNEDGNGEDEEDYSDGNGNVSGGESEDGGTREKDKASVSKDNEITTQRHHEQYNEIEESTTQTTPQSTLNLTLPCDSDRGGCEHECQMVKYYYDTEPTIQCFCYNGFTLDEYDGRRCHDIDECARDHGCEQICNNLPGSFECACHPGLQIDTTNNKKCIDINECSRNNGRGECQDVCRNTWGSFECSCENLQSTRLSPDGRTCEDAGECANNNGNCSHICLFTMKKIFCLCPEGHELGNDEKTCIDINECLENPSVCGSHKCENSYGTFLCVESPTTQSPLKESTTTEYSNKIEKDVDEDTDDKKEVESIRNIEDEEDEKSNESEIENERDQDEDIDEIVENEEGGETDNHDTYSTPEVMIPTPEITKESSTTEVSKTTSSQVESEDDSGEENYKEDEQNTSFQEEKKQMHHQSSTDTSNVGSECDNGLRLDHNGKCVGIDESTTEHEKHIVITSTPEHGAKMKPECQNVDGEGVECICPYGYELSDDESFCQDVNECEIYDNDDEDEHETDEENEAKVSFCSHTCTNLIGSFICSCPENFHIHDDKRTCVRDYCADLNNSELNKQRCSHECVDDHEGYSCRCPSGFTLQNDYRTCKQDVNNKINEVEKEDYEENEVEEAESIVECSSDDHEHCSPGNCLIVGSEKECTCPSGFIQKARRCVDFDECEHGKHQCSHSCYNTEGSFKCACPVGLRLSEDKQTCDDFDECSHDEEICGNLECSNTYGSYKCICRDGKEIDEHGKCHSSNLCDHNNGGCSHSCRSHHDEIICECPDGMDLDDDMKTCRNDDFCHVVPNGGCSHYCDSSQEPKCFCPPGYVLDNTGLICKEEFKCEAGFKLSLGDNSTCIDIDECSEDNIICLNGNCENREGSYHCHCHHGYELSEFNKTCIDIDECAREVSPCSHRCLNLPGSYQCGCPYGQVLIEDGHTCGFSDLCDFNNGGCAHECDFVDNKISCSCRKGYKIDDDDVKNCIDVDECEENNGGCQQSCINTEASSYCSCYDGYELNKNGFSCTDIDECVENNGNCSNICINLIGSHSCACEAGFMLGTDNETCYDIDECLEINDCSHICINTEGTYECGCPKGFLLGHDQFNCHDIDECVDSSLCINGECKNTNGSFLCHCSSGFELSEDGLSCIDVNECSHPLHRHTCSHYCVNSFGSFSCSCPEGMHLNDDMKTCHDVDECEIDSPCSHICENIERGFLCKCPEGFNLDNDERTCIDVDECLNRNHNCTDFCVNTEGSYECKCSSGLVLSSDGQTCEASNPCTIDNGGCSQICEFDQNHIVCSCRNGFEIDSNDKTLCKDINECSSENNCQQLCVNTIGSYKCECFPGFRFNENDQCIDIDECKIVNFRCPNSAQCINTAGSYKCICPDGFKLSRDKAECIEIKNECKSLTVKNGEARCTRSRHKTQLFYRTKCAISCDKGYKLHGPSIKHCNGTGYWDDNGEPACVALACPRLSKPDHGTILPANCMYGDTFSGERCFLHCPSGYKALGKRVAVCNNLQWHPRAELQCVPVRAPTVQLTSVEAPKHHQHLQQHYQHPRPTITCPEDMTVIKPKNQDTVLVRIAKPETNVDWNKYVDSQPIWGKRLEAAFSVGATEVTFRARSPFSNQFDICRVIINVVDPSPPSVTFCPDPFVVDLEQHELSRPVYWEEATFESKQQIKQIFKSKVPGHRFGPGVHPITYVASTQEGLSAKCSFRITVKAYETSLDQNQRIALETNTISDSYETKPKHLDNHESFLVCPGKQPIKIAANYAWHLPRGCVIKNIKVLPKPVHSHRRERPLKKHQHASAANHPLSIHHNVTDVSALDENLTAKNDRRSNRLRYYSSWGAQNQLIKRREQNRKQSYQEFNHQPLQHQLHNPHRLHNPTKLAHWN